MLFEVDDWELAEGIFDGRKRIIRQRATLPPTAERQLYCHLVIVAWPYDGGGMPDRSTHARMQLVEDALEAGTERRDKGFQVLSMTGLGRKEWRFYTADVESFIESLNDDLQGQGDVPLEIESWFDPDWNGLLEFRSSSDS